jgi:hypothetical protein
VLVAPGLLAPRVLADPGAAAFQQPGLAALGPRTQQERDEQALWRTLGP